MLPMQLSCSSSSMLLPVLLGSAVGSLTLMLLRRRQQLLPLSAAVMPTATAAKAMRVMKMQVQGMGQQAAQGLLQAQWLLLQVLRQHHRHVKAPRGVSQSLRLAAALP
jgi:hypothetical protein